MKKDKLFSIYGRCVRKIETREELYEWIEYAERMLKKYGWENRKVFPYTTAENSIDIVNYVKDYDNCTVGSKRYLMTFANRFGDILEAWIDIEERKRSND